ncbi:MAG: DUF3644 domain-containing protein [bacterium]
MTQTNFKEMFQLGQAVFLEGIKKLKEYKQMDFTYERNEMIIKKRLAVVEFVHGLELIFKAILVKQGYEIHKIPNKKIYKRNTTISQIASPNSTVELEAVINHFNKQYPSLKEKIKNINKLRSLRNQIIHKGTEISEKKKVYFLDAIDCIVEIYHLEDINNWSFKNKIIEAKEEI